MQSIPSIKAHGMSTAKTVLSSEGFNLIELLVVMAIVGILLVLVTPSFNAMRQSAMDQACASNLRQVSIACTAWSGDHNYMPVVSWYSEDAESNNKIWAQIVAPYMGGSLERPSNKAFTCPAQPHTTTADKWPAPWGGFTASVDYAQNLVGSGWPGGRPSRLLSPSTPLSKVVYFVEGRNIFYDSGSWNSQVVRYSSAHPSGSHYLFMDGHIETIKDPIFADVRDANF